MDGAVVFLWFGCFVYTSVHEWEILHPEAQSKTKASMNSMNVYEELPPEDSAPAPQRWSDSPPLLSHIMHSWWRADTHIKQAALLGAFTTYTPVHTKHNQCHWAALSASASASVISLLVTAGALVLWQFSQCTQSFSKTNTQATTEFEFQFAFDTQRQWRLASFPLY